MFASQSAKYLHLDGCLLFGECVCLRVMMMLGGITLQRHCAVKIGEHDCNYRSHRELSCFMYACVTHCKHIQNGKHYDMNEMAVFSGVFCFFFASKRGL